MKFGLIVLTSFLSLQVSAATVTVKINSSLKFEPAVVQIDVGDTLEFVNETRFPHTVTGDKSLVKNPDHVVLPEGAAPFHSGTIKPQERFSLTLKTPGHYKYTCIPHEDFGMQGEIDVVEAE